MLAPRSGSFFAGVGATLLPVGARGEHRSQIGLLSAQNRTQLTDLVATALGDVGLPRPEKMRQTPFARVSFEQSS